ncbi:MAG: hypothetical protein V4603_19030, partial [Pseudomonadota bacterium]
MSKKRTARFASRHVSFFISIGIFRVTATQEDFYTPSLLSRSGYFVVTQLHEEKATTFQKYTQTKYIQTKQSKQRGSHVEQQRPFYAATKQTGL